MKHFLVDFVVFSLEKMGFVNRHRWYINGDPSRLIIHDSSINKKRRIGFVNTIFNTRSGNITIGNNVIFGHDVMVLTGRHNYSKCDPLAFKERVSDGYDIVIDDGCWITSGVIIVGGVTIGRGSVILPGSVVTKDVPCFTVAGGVPARVIKMVSDGDPPES